MDVSNKGPSVDFDSFGKNLIPNETSALVKIKTSIVVIQGLHTAVIYPQFVRTFPPLSTPL